MRFVNSSLWRLLLFDTSSAFAHSASICRLYNQRVKSRLKGFYPKSAKPELRHYLSLYLMLNWNLSH